MSAEELKSTETPPGEEISFDTYVQQVIISAGVETKPLQELSPEEREKLCQEIRRAWGEKPIVVSGKEVTDPATGEREVQPYTDVDGKVAIGLLELAGITDEKTKVQYVRPGDFVKGGINLDTGKRYGVVFDGETGTIFIDHHERGPSTSTSELLYEVLVRLGMISPSEALQRLVRFATAVDNRWYGPEQFPRSDRSILGVHSRLTFKQLLELFEDHTDGTEALTEEEIDEYGLREHCNQQRKLIESETKALEELERSGQFIITPHGRIVINREIITIDPSGKPTKIRDLITGASVAYLKFDGILNVTLSPEGKVSSFSVAIKEGMLNRRRIEEVLGKERVPGFFTPDGRMWVCRKVEGIEIEDIIRALDGKRPQEEA